MLSSTMGSVAAIECRIRVGLRMFLKMGLGQNVVVVDVEW